MYHLKECRIQLILGLAAVPLGGLRLKCAPRRLSVDAHTVHTPIVYRALQATRGGKAVLDVNPSPSARIHPFVFQTTTPRTYDLYDLFPLQHYSTTALLQHYYSTTLHRFDLPGRGDLFPILIYVANVARWEPYSPHDLAHVSRVGCVPHRYCRSLHHYITTSLRTVG